MKTAKKYVTTNVRLSQDLYQELKLIAAKKKTSLAAVIRERLEKGRNRKLKNWTIEEGLNVLRGSAQGIYGGTKNKVDSYVSDERASWDE